jgi:integrase
VPFSEITTSVLRHFSAYLKSEHDVSERTIMNYLVVIRTIYNQAIADGFADKKNYPFGKGKIVIKFPDTLKYGLSPAELKSLESEVLPAGQNHARNLFLVSFYFAGMRASDLLRLKWSDFQDGRLYYKMGKNEKAGSVKVPEKVLAILNQYPKSNAHDLVFFDIANVEDLNDGLEVQRRI